MLIIALLLIFIVYYIT